jgi:hypothetical protein
MKLKIPVNLNEAIIAIADLQAAANWMEGQLNLLLSFITSSPKNKESFVEYAGAIANADLPPENEEMQKVAKILSAGMNTATKHNDTNSPDENNSLPVGKKSDLGSNVLQFPKLKPDQT